MKTLYLLRHAKSSWKKPARDDFERPLSKRGRRAAHLIGEYLGDRGIRPAQILCSPARRTRETCEHLESRFAAAVPVRLEKGIYLADAPALLRRLRRLSDSLPSVMVIGHNPGLERLALILIGAGDVEARQRLESKFPTGALAVLTADIDQWRLLGPGCARLEVFVRPKDLAERG